MQPEDPPYPPPPPPEQIVVRSIAVRHVRLIGKEQQIDPRQASTHALNDGESTEPGIEQADHCPESLETGYAFA